MSDPVVPGDWGTPHALIRPLSQETVRECCEPVFLDS